jgi:hypothetical protein
MIFYMNGIFRWAKVYILSSKIFLVEFARDI